MTEGVCIIVSEWVEASCAAQGVPVKVADRYALAAVAELLGVRQVRRRSDAPDRIEAGRIETVEAAAGGPDD
jgi:hypothetical protein